jgi:hypothetical protein
MYWTGIAIQHNISDLLVLNKGLKGFIPVVRGAAKGNVGFRIKLERAVPSVKTDAPYLCTRQTQHFAKPVEKGPMRTLKEKKTSVLTCDQCNNVPLMSDTFYG